MTPRLENWFSITGVLPRVRPHGSPVSWCTDEAPEWQVTKLKKLRDVSEVTHL